MFLINLGLHFGLIFLSYIIPKKKNLLIFGGGDKNEFQGHPKYMYLHLKTTNNKEFEYYWVTGSKTIQTTLDQKGFPVINRYSWKGFFTHSGP